MPFIKGIDNTGKEHWLVEGQEFGIYTWGAKAHASDMPFGVAERWRLLLIRIHNGYATDAESKMEIILHKELSS